MQKFFTFLKSRDEPPIGWGVWAILVYFENQRTDLLGQYDLRVSNQNRLHPKRDQSGRRIPFYKFYVFASKILTGSRIAKSSESDLVMIDLEAKDWESIYQRGKRQAGEIPASVLIEWGK